MRTDGRTIRNVWVVGLLGAALLFVPGCRRSSEDVADDLEATMAEMADVLSTVRDEASARAAKPRLEALSRRMADLLKETADLPAPCDIRRPDVAERFMQETQRVGNDPVLKELLSPMPAAP